jgi:hypothetical protein
MPNDANVPAPSGPLDRSALERVLARAAELQAGTGEPGDELTEAQILELGGEVGLAPQHLRQALAEERSRSIPAHEDTGLGARLMGPARISASRVVTGTTRELLPALDDWMQRQEGLRVKRHLPDRIVWEPSRDLFGAVQRMLNFGRRDFALARSFEVAATVVPVDEARSLVRLDADFTHHRASLARQSAGLSLIGVASSGVLVALGFAVAIAAAPAVLVGAVSIYGSRELHAHAVTRAQLALDQLLDQVERGGIGRPAAPSLLGALAAAAANLPRKR